MTDDAVNTRARAAHELMQQLYIPGAAPIAGVEHAVMYRFGAHVGGDVADVFDCGSDGVFVSLADIEGSGQDAAVHAAMVKYGIRAYACELRDPRLVLERLNMLYLRNCRSEGTESFATLFLALVEADRRKMTYVSAGYEAALLVHPNGFSQVLTASGPVVGVLDGGQASFRARTVELEPGSMLVAVSDGVTDVRLGNRCYGLSRVRHLLSERSRAGLDELVAGVIDSASSYCRGKICDDMAVLAVRFGAEG